MTPPLVLVLGTAEWNAPIATNQHYVCRELARSFRVVFAEGTGTRRLRLSLDDVRRLRARLRPDAAPAGRTVPPSMLRLTPLLVPHHGRSTRAINSALLNRQLRSWRLHPGARVLWTYTPYTYGLERLADLTVYHLVDLLHHNPGVCPRRLLAAERTLAVRTGLALATSGPIAAHLGQQGFRHVELLPNVADVGPFLAAADTTVRSEPPVVLFIGALATHKLDIDLLELLAKRLRGRAVLRLAGPSAAGTDPHDWDRLRAAGAELLPAQQLPALAALVAGAAVGLIPYRLNELTRGISPLKTYEYLAAGLPVVSTQLPSIQPVPGAVWAEADAEAFVARVLSLLEAPAGSGASASRRRLAARHDWTARGAVLRTLLEDRLPAGRITEPAA